MRYALGMYVASVMLVTALAHADDAPSATEARRTELYREGVRLSDRGDWKEAVLRFREVVAIRSAPKALVALAIAEEKLGHLLEAKRILERASRDADDPNAPREEVSRTAKELASGLTARVPRISVKVPAEDGRLVVDGTVVRTRDAIEVDPGEHTFEFESADGRRVSKSVILSEGVRSEIGLQFGSESKAFAAESRAPESPGLPLGPIALLGAGLAIAGGGAVAWAMGDGE